MKNCLFIVLALWAMPWTVNAQTTDEDLAKYYFDSGEYNKALLYYDKLYKENPSSDIYHNYFESLVKTEDYKSAEKLAKEQYKRTHNDLYNLDLGQVYEIQGDSAKADKLYENSINDLPASQALVMQLANKFIEQNKLHYALETYEKGKRMMKGGYPFDYEIASLYGTMGNTQKMVSSYLDLVAFNPAYLQTVQNALSRTIDFQANDDKAALLRDELLKRVQKDPQNQIFSEMLIWLYIQRKEFEGAFIQVRALDKRLDDGGQRVFELGKLCVRNDEYDVAGKCFDYVAKLGKDNPLHIPAKEAYLQNERARLMAQPNPSKEELTQLADGYRNLLKQEGESNSTLPLMRDLADLEAYHLQEADSAITLLQSALKLPGVSQSDQAQCKLDLGDIALTQGYIWDASLLYSQVEKDFKFDVLGSEAKFKNAQISYYTGNFKWAQAQLDVLKASTSKLISNDAMELSLLISDNLNLDTSNTALLMYAKADLLVEQSKYDQAIQKLDSIDVLFPGHSLADEILFEKAKIAKRQAKFQDAAKLYKQVVDQYGSDILGDISLLDLAKLYDGPLNDKDKAEELYKQLMLNYPGSIYVEDARRRYRELRGDKPGEAPKINLNGKDENP